MNFVCPYDKSSLTILANGEYSCSVCNRTFSKNNGIYMFSSLEDSAWTDYGKAVEVYKNIEPISPSHFWINLIEKSRPFKSTDIVIDLGAGDGAQTALLSNKVKELHWIDLSYYQLKKAYQRHLENTFCVFSDVTRLPYDNDVSDVCISVFLFEHLPYKQCILMLKEANRVLKKGGLFLLVTENPIGDYIYKRILSKITGISFGSADPTHINMLFPGRLKRLIKNNGFRIIGYRIPVIGEKRAKFLKRILPEFITQNFMNISYGYLCEKL
ncbi:MAG: class I SAM-dependent methyltransferase [bacterium]